jgi:translocation and assembly module TamB
LSTSPRGPADIEAMLRGIETGEARLRTASLRVEGTRAAHIGVVQAQGERVDFRARARGGLTAGGGWSGTLEDLVNAGEAAVRLVAPVAISVAPKRVRADPFELRIVGGRLNVKAFEYERGRLATAGRFNDVPLRPLLTIAGVAGSFAGTLRLSGEWSLEGVPLLKGVVRITRESGDVALGADRTLSLGLQALSVNASFTDAGASFEARLASALASGAAEGRARPVGAGPRARYTAASPVEFTASVDIARLTPFASLIDTAMLLEGEAHAKLRGAGTLGDPLITGPITADRVAIALPAEGIDLKGGALRAHLAQREIRVESFSIKGGEGVFHAQGTLARAGFSEASVDWRAEQFAVLRRPDRRLVVSGKGNAALKGGKLAFTGALRAHEGLFELATAELPTLGDDVVIVGRERAATAVTPASPSDPPRKATRAAVDMSIDLGNNVQLRGRGLDVWLSGDLKVRTDEQGQLRASGSVDARRGTFVAYGQRLEIERARFYFNGPIANPGLDILAMRKRQAVEAGVAVTGTMSRPIVRVVSNPPLPEGEALSWLVLGRAPDQAGAGQLAALPLATGALVGKAGAPIARALHVDEVGVRSGDGASAQQFLTVGKRITERLYLAFEQSLGGTENLLRLEWSLTQRIALRAQTGSASSLGVFYRYSWD